MKKEERRGKKSKKFHEEGHNTFKDPLQSQDYLDSHLDKDPDKPIETTKEISIPSRRFPRNLRLQTFEKRN